MTSAVDARSAMDRMYRAQRHIYDLTRKFYLFGRDTLIAQLPVQPGETLCEVGCGTARNLVMLAKRHPRAKFFGVDASEEMLKSAKENLAKGGVEGQVPLAVTLAQDFDWRGTFGLERPFDRLLYSYSLSMMDDWQAALEHGFQQLKPRGSVHIVDFGNQEGLPPWFKKMLGAWLDKFHVRFRPEVRAYFEAQEKAGRGRMTYRTHMRGYAYLLTFELN